MTTAHSDILWYPQDRAPQRRTRWGFYRDQDRYYYYLTWRPRIGSAWETILDSRVSATADGYPADLVLQSCQTIATPKGDQIAGTGASGFTYWSLALAGGPNLTDNITGGIPAELAEIWEFQIACRVPTAWLAGSSVTLGTRYEIRGPWLGGPSQNGIALRVSEEHSIFIEPGTGCGEIQVQPRNEGDPVQRREILILPGRANHFSAHQNTTLQWNYRISLRGSSA